MSEDKKIRLLLKCSAYLCLLFATSTAGASDPSENGYYRLTITDSSGNDHVFSTEELLRREDVETITIKDISAYPRQTMTYKAVKFASLLEQVDVDSDASVEFIARDGFTSPLDADLLMNTSPQSSIAYLAIEDPQNKWPRHSSGEETAGPFYLLWLNPELSDIGREEWPFKFNQVVVREPVASRYAAIVPDTGEDHTVQRGFDVFIKNCIACHKLGRTGPGSMGPDLNYPMSPVEYFREGILRKFIRDPQSVRLYPGSAMGPFPKEILSDEELDQLISYLEYMAQRR